MIKITSINLQAKTAKELVKLDKDLNKKITKKNKIHWKEMFKDLA